MEEDDTKCLLDYLQERKYRDPSSSYSIQHDVNHQVITVDLRKMVVNFVSLVTMFAMILLMKQTDFLPLAKQVLFWVPQLYIRKCIQSCEWLFQAFITTMFGQRPNSWPMRSQGRKIQDPRHPSSICGCQIYRGAFTSLKHIFSTRCLSAKNVVPASLVMRTKKNSSMHGR